MNLEPGGLLAWILVGLVAGFLAGQVMKASRGRANPNVVRELIEQKLSS